MATHQVGLIGRVTGNVFVYVVATDGERPTDQQLFDAALIEHGRNVVRGHVTETVRGDMAEITETTAR